MGQIENMELILRRLACGELRQSADNASIECCPLGTTLAKDKGDTHEIHIPWAVLPTS